ncbi:MAG: response regulator transcription factor [Acidobacteriota bacterium]|jgi:DNA-binding response OmpR family regulator|nr:response regulator transcription factor [Acidobacteriota bacterium]
MKILVVEDEKHLAEGLRFNLEFEEFEVKVADDGEKALEMLAENNFDAVVLDVMLPKVDGFTVAKTMRDAEDYTPILMLTALGKPEDVLKGFESGTDDYLQKPFELNIFLARLKSLLRRQKWSNNNEKGNSPIEKDVIKINSKIIDFSNLELKTDEKTIQLTLMEAKLLRHLIEKSGQAVSRKEILEEVWDLHEETDTRAIDNFIVRLRRYLEENPAKPEILQTVRGIGYKFIIK